MEKIKSFINYILVPVVTITTGLLVVYVDTQVKNNDYEISRRDLELKQQMAVADRENKARDLAINKKLNDLDLVIRESKEQREERESNQKFNLKIYDIVSESLEQKDEKKQEAAKAFIVVMVEEPLRTSLLSVLEEEAEPPVQKKINKILSEETLFKEQVAELPQKKTDSQPSFAWDQWDFDIFWCSSSGSQAKEQAQLIAEQLLAEQAKGRIRVRELPASKNAQSGYRASGYEIRRNTNEIEVAEALGELGNTILQKHKVNFTFRTTTQPTAWYVSTFVCPGS